MIIMEISLLTDLTQKNSPSDIFLKVLKVRGYRSKESIATFLAPPFPTLNYLLENIKIKSSSLTKTKAIVEEEIQKGRDICVFGDYDADGITSTAILWQTLKLLSQKSSARILPFIPDRTRHGYGLSSRALDDILSGSAFQGTHYKDFSPSLIITVDNGITANEQVARLRANHIKVIISDHHTPGTTLPKCDAIIHSDITSGAGIAWLTSLYISDSLQAVLDFIDLAAIGVTADQLPLKGINRSIVKHGLMALSNSKNKGLNALIKSAGLASPVLSTYDINYVLAPRLNAVGRIDNPLTALRLLCSDSDLQTATLAKMMNSSNEVRQELTSASLSLALKSPAKDKVMVASSPEFHEGIIGLVAGKLAETHSRPAIVISEGKEVSKGSARSPKGVNITTLLRQTQDLLLSVGGHEQAAGFSLKTDKIPEFIAKITRIANTEIKPELLVKKVTAIAELLLSQISLPLATLFEGLEPFGIGNSKPRFVSRNLTVLEWRFLGSGKHSKFTVEQDGVSREVIWFNSNLATPPSHISSLVYTIDINRFRSNESLQLTAQYVVL